MMSRRTFLCMLALGILSAPPAGQGQPAGKVPRIGWLATSAPGSFGEAFGRAYGSAVTSKVKTLLSNGDRSKETSPACLRLAPNCWVSTSTSSLPAERLPRWPCRS